MVIFKIRNIGRSTFGRWKFRPPLGLISARDYSITIEHELCNIRLMTIFFLLVFLFFSFVFFCRATFYCHITMRANVEEVSLTRYKIESTTTWYRCVVLPWKMYTPGLHSSRALIFHRLCLVKPCYYKQKYKNKCSTLA